MGRDSGPTWLARLKDFEKASAPRALWQLGNTVLPYAGIWAAMVYLMQRGFPYWVILPLVVLAAFLLVRIFIFFHDCCHGSFLRGRGGNRAVGFVAGVLTFTPFAEFRHSHGIHHSTAGNLDRRGVGDVWTMTLQEYRSSPWLRRLKYRAYRSPFVLFLLGPIFMFLISNRFPRPGASRERVRSILLTDLAIVAIAVFVGVSWGWSTYFLIQIPVLGLAGAMGTWLFYVQHQFDPSYWARTADWTYVDAALQGSSYYRLPRVLQWASGNIGLHHLHHLRPRIPNYRLQACLEAVPELKLERPLTLLSSLASVWLNLWDEKRGRLVRFRAAAAR